MQIRQTYEVYVNIYDFTSANKALECLGLGAYHTGVELNNIEYCYAVVSEDPNETGILLIEPETAGYTFKQKQYMGVTQLSFEELGMLTRNLETNFTCGRYNVFSWNCNHFSNELLKELVGKELPQYMFRLTNFFRYICCCLPEKMVNGQWALKYLMGSSNDEDEPAPVENPGDAVREGSKENQKPHI